MAILLVGLATAGIFGGILAVRAATIPPLQAGVLVWTVLDPLPRVVSGDLRQLYVAVIPQVANGQAPYQVDVFIGGVLYEHYYQQYSYSSTAPVIWSQSAPSTAGSTLQIIIRVVDNTTAVASVGTTIPLPVG